jgi:hypothetical protein
MFLRLRRRMSCLRGRKKHKVRIGSPRRDDKSSLVNFVGFIPLALGLTIELVSLGAEVLDLLVLVDVLGVLLLLVPGAGEVLFCLLVWVRRSSTYCSGVGCDGREQSEPNAWRRWYSMESVTSIFHLFSENGMLWLTTQC